MMPMLLFVVACLVLLSGYPVAFSLAGTALLFAGIGTVTGSFDAAFLQAMPNRLYGIMTNNTLLAVPLFVFMGVMLERSKIAENLLEVMGQLFGEIRLAEHGRLVWLSPWRIGHFGHFSRHLAGR